MIRFSSRLRTIAANAILAVGALAAANANAGKVFTVNEGSNGLVSPSFPIAEFQADKIVGSSTVRLQKVAGPGFDYTGVGYIQYSGFSLNSSNVNGSYLGANFRFEKGYNLYARFTQTVSCPAGLAKGVECAVTGISLALVADAIADGAATFNQAVSGSDPTVTGGGPQVLLANGNVAVGVSGVNALGGAYQNVNTNIALTAEGKLFFTAPDPFYTLTFNSFNNNSGGLTGNAAGTEFIIVDESGATTFGDVPEPASLALFGLALAGVASARRRKKK